MNNIFNGDHQNMVANAIEFFSKEFDSLEMKGKANGLHIAFQLPIKKLMSEMQFGHKSFEMGCLMMKPALAYIKGKSFSPSVRRYEREFRLKFVRYMELALHHSKNFEELNNFYEIFHSYAR